MTDEGMDYLSLVREEFAERNLQNANKVSFCKVKKDVTKETTNKEFLNVLVEDVDTPHESDTKWIPINMNQYPRVCSTMTANQAGYYAIRKCQEQKWDFLTDWKCVLTQLEMD